MSKQIGIDIVEFEEIRERLSDRFINRILSEQELEKYNQIKNEDRKMSYLAGRFAAKEAVIKALGKFLTDKPTLPEIQIINDSTGQPELCLTEKISDKVKATCFISITHEKSVAAAVAIFSEEK